VLEGAGMASTLRDDLGASIGMISEAGSFRTGRDLSSRRLMWSFLALVTSSNASLRTRGAAREGSEKRDEGSEESRRVERKMALKWLGEDVGGGLSMPWSLSGVVAGRDGIGGG
jgi:hypothetical protein